MPIVIEVSELMLRVGGAIDDEVGGEVVVGLEELLEAEERLKRKVKSVSIGAAGLRWEVPKEGLPGRFLRFSGTDSPRAALQGQKPPGPPHPPVLAPPHPPLDEAGGGGEGVLGATEPEVTLVPRPESVGDPAINSSSNDLIWFNSLSLFLNSAFSLSN